MISVLRKLWRSKFEHKDLAIQNILKPIILITSLFGLLPHSVKFSKSKRNYNIIPYSIYLNCLCGVAILLLLFTFFVLHVQYEFAKPYIKELSSQINYVVELVTFLILCGTAYVWAFLNRSKYIKILNMIVSTWTNIPSSHIRRTTLNKLRVQRNIMLIGVVAIIITQMYINISVKQRSLWEKLFNGIAFNMPQVIQFNLHAFYTILVISVSAILCNISGHCQLMEKDKNTSNPFTIEVRPVVKNITLRQMELLYMKAFEIKTDINDAFKGPMLASILQSFHALVSEAHAIYNTIIIEESRKSYGIQYSMFWVICQIIKIYSLSYSGDLLKLEASKIGQALHYISTEKQDLRHFMEVQHFSTLLKYQSMEINLYGYFPLDATLMFNLFASATMYLIILVQFG